MDKINGWPLPDSMHVIKVTEAMEMHMFILQTKKLAYPPGQDCDGDCSYHICMPYMQVRLV